MARDQELDQQSHRLTDPTQRLSRYGIPLRRRKLPIVRLGGGQKARRGVGVARVFRRMRVRWVKVQYRCMLKKLKESYRKMVKELMEASASLETFHQRLFLESSFAIPMGVSISSYPSIAGSDRPRTALFM